MGSVLNFRRRPRALRKTYDPAAPYRVERIDHESGSCTYEIMDTRPESYRIVGFIFEDEDGVDRGQAMKDADLIVRALNFHHAYQPQ
jgi:hypothetical protein